MTMRDLFSPSFVLSHRHGKLRISDSVSEPIVALEIHISITAYHGASSAIFNLSKDWDELLVRCRGRGIRNLRSGEFFVFFAGGGGGGAGKKNRLIAS